MISARLCFTGDFCLGAGLLDQPAFTAAAVLEPAIVAHLAKHDLVLSNLEFAVAPDSDAAKFAHLKMAVAVARTVPNLPAGVHVMSLANNHVMDCGSDGLRSATQALESRGIHHVGAGTDLSGACQPLMLELKGRKIAVIAACDHARHYAGSASAGIAPLSPRSLEAQVQLAKTRSDAVIVLLHADLEFSEYPAPWRVRLSRRLVDCGAVAVVQHHPHVLQGYENRGNAVIAYSLGNFVFRISGNTYQQSRAGTRIGALLSLELRFEGETTVALPTLRFIEIGEDNRTRLVPAGLDTSYAEAIGRLSSGLRSVRSVRVAWRRRSQQEMLGLLRSIYYSLARRQPGRAMRILLETLRAPQDRRWLLGWLTGGRL